MPLQLTDEYDRRITLGVHVSYGRTHGVWIDALAVSRDGISESVTIHLTKEQALQFAKGVHDVATERVTQAFDEI